MELTYSDFEEGLDFVYDADMKEYRDSLSWDEKIEAVVEKYANDTEWQQIAKDEFGVEEINYQNATDADVLDFINYAFEELLEDEDFDENQVKDYFRSDAYALYQDQKIESEGYNDLPWPFRWFACSFFFPPEWISYITK